MEIWKDIKGYEGLYQVSSLGNVRSLDRVIVLKDRLGNDRPSLYKGRILKPCINRGGYYSIVLSKDSKTSTKTIHRIMAVAFLGATNKSDITNHIDGNKLNNNLNNLEIITSTENTIHAFEKGLIPTRKKVLMLDKNTLEVLMEFEGENVACKYVGVCQGKVGRAIKRDGTCKGYKWKYK